MLQLIKENWQESDADFMQQATKSITQCDDDAWRKLQTCNFSSLQNYKVCFLVLFSPILSLQLQL